MKITLELPEDLVRRMKLRAAQEGRKLKDVAAQVFKHGLAAPVSAGRPARRRVELPVIQCRHKAKPREALTPSRIAEILAKQEIPEGNVSSGR